ncbi:hypothetical protein ACHAWF_006173, partial [Thalassiosira exigua]
ARRCSPSDASVPPSTFCTKLRKHLRGLRLEGVVQLGKLDRVVDLRFGSGDRAHHLILELYGRGNLILCDREYRILTLLRTHEYDVARREEGEVGEGKDGEGKDDEGKDVGGGAKEAEEGGVKVRVGNVYPVTFATTLPATGDGADGSREAPLLAGDGRAAREWATSELEAARRRARAAAADETSDEKGKKKGGKKKKKKKGASDDGGLVLKALLLRPSSGAYHYGPSLIEHCARCAGLDPLAKLTLENLDDAMPGAAWGDLVTALRDEGSKAIERLTTGEGGQGYVLYKPKAAGDGEDEREERDEPPPPDDSPLLPPTVVAAARDPHADRILLEFQPHLLLQHRDRNHVSYPDFAAAVDDFFGRLASQRAAARADAAEASARAKLEKVRADQARRAEGLASERERRISDARLVERHASAVDDCLSVLRSALEAGTDWEALDRLVRAEQEDLNPVALLIHELRLEEDEQVVLALPDADDWDEGSGAPPPVRRVTASIRESAHGNARRMYASHRASKEKEERTAEASAAALAAAEAKARRQLAQAGEDRRRAVAVLPRRRPHWFEKFAWFVTSDDYLVVAGKDAQQNEMLVKRYLRPGDAYLHADVHGAATCILRAKRRRRKDGRTQVVPLSDQALREAGNFTICRSSAWSSRTVTSAYWVESHQVSKTAPTGEYLTTGSFMIRGRKNFLPPSSLEMGLAVLFRLGDEASVARHAGERRDFALMEQEQIMKEREELEERATKDEPATTSSSKEPDADSELGVDKLVIAENPEEDGADIGPQEDIDDAGKNPADENAGTELTPPPKDLPHQSTSPNKGEGNSVSFEKKGAQAPKTSAKKKEKELSRGKRSKNRRAKKKYAEQDDEDRELAMMALQGGEGTSKKNRRGKGSRIVKADSEAQKKASEEAVALLVRDSEEAAKALGESVRGVLSECVTVNGGVRWDKFDAEVLEQLGGMDSTEEQLAAANRLLELATATRVDNFSASLAGIIRTVKRHGTAFQEGNAATRGAEGKQRKSKAEKQAEKEAWQEILAEDGIVENDGDDENGAVDDTAEIGKLTGKPAAQDLILYAIPVCAPYPVLSQYKYRVKLTPGSVKRGKASKQAVEMFLQSDGNGIGKKKNAVDEGTKRDLALIKLVNENEWVQAIIGDVRITSAGASKVTKKQKGKGRPKK